MLRNISPVKIKKYLPERFVFYKLSKIDEVELRAWGEGDCMMKEHSCSSCSYFEDHVLNQGKTEEETGLCRFNPPITQPEPDSRGLWPVVSSEDWCGHFEQEKQ